MIWQYVFVLIAGLVAALIQTTVAPYFFHGRLSLDLFFVMVVIIGLFKKSFHGAVMAFLLGAFEDLYSGEIFGLYMCARTSVYFFANRISRRFSPNEPVGQAAIAGGIGLFDKILIIGLLALFSPGPAWVASDFGFMALEVVVNALFVALLYPLFRWVPGLLEQSLESPLSLKGRTG